jgi:tetratricopeptide (TPR) repeat protein
MRSPAEALMRIPALCTLVIAAVLGLAGPAAAAGPAWCAAYRNGSTNCGFNTYEQCLAAISGIGGFCNRNYIDGPSDKPAARKERKEREAEPKARRKEKEEVKERVAPKPVPPPAAAQPAPVIVQPQPMPVVVQPPAAPAQQPANNFQMARALILSGKYEAGIAAMKSLGFDDHPDIASSIGFAYAKLGNPGEARSWYNRALAADPNHISTLVYSGALYVAQGDLAKARGDLDRIKAICGAAACSESQELEGQIAAKSR